MALSSLHCQNGPNGSRGKKEENHAEKESAEKKELGNAKTVSLYYLTMIIV
jgi:hypothetical protein